MYLNERLSISFVSSIYFDRFDECHKAKNVTLDENDKAVLESTENAFDDKGKAGSSKTAAAVVELQRRLPRARVVYCSATSVSDPANLGFMSRLGLWGPGTEHPTGFNNFLKAIEILGMGAMELHALHLKSKGAMLARTLSYSNCEFSLVDDVMNNDMIKMYDAAADLWHDLYVKLTEQTQQKEDERLMAVAIERAGDGALTNDQARFREVHANSDDEGEMTQAEKTAAEYRRKCRNRKQSMVRSLYWVSPTRAIVYFPFFFNDFHIYLFALQRNFISSFHLTSSHFLINDSCAGSPPALLSSNVYWHEGRLGNQGSS